LNRRAILALLAASSMLGARPAPARLPAAVSRLGVFFGGYREPMMKEGRDLLKGLADVGYVEGRNLAVEWRFCEMDFSHSAQLATELVRVGVDALATAGTPLTRVLQEATKSIPIITEVADPVASGFTETLGRPSRNITGLSNEHQDTPAKRIELIRRMVPNVDRLVLIGDVRVPSERQMLRPHESAAKAAGLRPAMRLVDTTGFEGVFSEMKGLGARVALIDFPVTDKAELAALAIRYGVATMMINDTDYVDSGGLMGYFMLFANPIGRLAAVIDKVFRGVKPADIPWELPDRSKFSINLSTARLLGLTVPPDLLLRADQIVE
jgi:ABC-type uncharacterized transport system substrate-binding protein